MALVAIQVVRVRIVGDEHVHPAVAVHVGGTHGESEGERLVLQPRLARRVDEASAVVPEVMIGSAFQAERTEGDLLDAFPRQRPLRLQHVVDGLVDVAGDEHVEIAIAVRVEEGGTRVPARRLEADPRGDVLECAIALVPVQQVRAEYGDQDVGPAVVVIVRDEGALPPAALSADPGAIRDVLERPVGAPVVQGVAALLDDGGAIELPAVHQVHVQTAVPVIVEERDAGPRGIEEVILARPAGEQHAGDAGLLVDVHEPEPWRRGADGPERRCQQDRQYGARCSRGAGDAPGRPCGPHFDRVLLGGLE